MEVNHLLTLSWRAAEHNLTGVLQGHAEEIKIPLISKGITRQRKRRVFLIYSLTLLLILCF